MGQPKQLLELAGRPVAAWSLEALAAAEPVNGIIIACEPAQRAAFTKLAQAFGRGKVHGVVAGGASRQDSVSAALRTIEDGAEIIVVHDGARPFATSALVEEVIEQARAYGGAIAAVPVKDTIKQADDKGVVNKTIARERLWAAQTPQAFACEVLRRAHEQAEADGFLGTDDAELVERLGGASVAIVAGSYDNLKITTPEDLVIAEQLASRLLAHGQVT